MIMVRYTITGVFCLCAFLLCPGCSSFVASRAIEQFAQGLEQGSLDELKAVTSDDFERRALRTEESITALKVLPLPTGEQTITEIEVLGEQERLVTVDLGDGSPPVKYRLRQEQSKSPWLPDKWVIDDVILSQKRSGDKPPLTKSVTEQMDLLLTVQSFLKNWREGNRAQALAVMHPSLRAQLESLSPVHLAQVTEAMIEAVKLDTFRPEARIADGKASVSLPRSDGRMVIELMKSMDASDSEWQVSEVYVESKQRDGTLPSVFEMARMVGVASEFFKAYERSDREALSRLSSESFFRDALVAADLSTQPIPTVKLLSTRFEIERIGDRAEILFEVGDDTYLVNVRRNQAPGPVSPASATTLDPYQYHIEEVTIYEDAGSQIKPLSSVFTAQAVVEVFAEGLSQRDVSLLQHVSSRDFNRRVWNRLEDPSLLARMDLHDIPDAPPRIVTTIFQGQVAEVTVTQGTKALTYVLHSGQGRPAVDDVLIPVTNRPGSLKVALESLTPIYNFAYGWSRQRKDILQRSTADSLRRMIWAQTRRLPEIEIDLESYLTATLRKYEDVENDRLVTLGNQDRGATIRLVREGHHYVIEDIHVHGPQFTDGSLAFVTAMKNWIIDSRSPASEYFRDGQVMQASAKKEQTAVGETSQADDASSGKVVHAHATRTNPAAKPPKRLNQNLLNQAIPIPR